MKAAVLGAGSWGLALAVLLHRRGHAVSLWGREGERLRRLQQSRRDDERFPGLVFPSVIHITSDPAEALKAAQAVVWVLPCQATRRAARELRNFFPTEALFVHASKGLEEETYKRISEQLKEETGKDFGVLSGPSHAEEVARGLPASVVAAAEDRHTAEAIQKLFHGEDFRVYTSTDRLGVELGGALKNVIAIAAGVLDGLELGDSAKAALMTRGLHEITRLAEACGAEPQTLSGLAGVGDLWVTCTSRYSRNRRLGEKIGKGEKPRQAISAMTQVAEGVATAAAACRLARSAGVEVPICEQVHAVLMETVSVRQAVKNLLSRSAKAEREESDAK